MKSYTLHTDISSSEVDNKQTFRAFSFMSRTQDIANLHASAIGFGYKDLISSNSAWVLSRMRVKYLKAPKWEDKVSLVTWHKGRDGVFSLRDFEMHDASDDTLMIAATSSWLIIDLASRRMLRPDTVLGDVGVSTSLERDAIEEHCGKLRFSCEMTQHSSVEVSYSDIDMNAHTNNAKYVEWAFDCIPTNVVLGRLLDEYQINFNRETRLGDKVDLFLGTEDENTFCVEGRLDNTSIFQITIRFKS